MKDKIVRCILQFVRARKLFQKIKLKGFNLKYTSHLLSGSVGVVAASAPALLPCVAFASLASG